MASKKVIENWKKIKGFPDYEVSDLGRVKGKSGELRCFFNRSSAHPERKSSLAVSLVKDGSMRMCSVPRLVADHFCLPKPRTYKNVVHLNGNSEDNRACNLKWGSFREAVRVSRGLEI